MLRRFVSFTLVTVAVLLARPAQAAGGFVIGVEGGYGGWGFDASKLQDSPADQAVTVSMQDGEAFGQSLMNGFDLDLHLGWNFFGHASLEATLDATSWNLFNSQRGGAGFVGGRATWFPMQLFLSAARKYDVGIELGAGYSIAGGPTANGGPSFGMDGPYFELGLTGEYRISKSVGFTLGIRHFFPNWNKFYVDYNNNLSAAVTGVSAGWTTITVGVALHVNAG